MNRVVFFIDGFNLYHAIDNNPLYYKYKWLNLAQLANCYVTKKNQIIDIFYFTALATWSSSKVKKHNLLIKALELKGIKVVYGEFRKKNKTCPLCKKIYSTFEEKQSDVNIAINLLELAIQDQFDTAIIVSGDSDLIP